MHIQQRLGDETLRANRAHKRPLLLVRLLHVNIQRAPLRVALLAELAHERLLLRVHHAVHGERALRVEPLPTRSARVRLLPVVQIHVVRERRAAVDLLTADLAHEELLQVLHLHVLRQARRLRERLLALVAMEAPLHVPGIVLRLLVVLEVRLPGEDLAANVALKTHAFVHLLVVHQVRVFRDEASTARLAMGGVAFLVRFEVALKHVLRFEASLAHFAFERSGIQVGVLKADVRAQFLLLDELPVAQRAGMHSFAVRAQMFVVTRFVLAEFTARLARALVALSGGAFFGAHVHLHMVQVVAGFAEEVLLAWRASDQVGGLAVR